MEVEAYLIKWSVKHQLEKHDNPNRTDNESLINLGQLTNNEDSAFNWVLSWGETHRFWGIINVYNPCLYDTGSCEMCDNPHIWRRVWQQNLRDLGFSQQTVSSIEGYGRMGRNLPR
jgi:hypothetical protein